METLPTIVVGVTTALAPINLLVLVAGAIVGMIIGVIPGISAANGIALMLPVTQTFGLAPESALILYAAVYYGAKYGGRISAILADAPGDISASATRLEGFPMALAGKAGLALSITAVSSFIGGAVATLVLAFSGFWLVHLGDAFGPAEYVAMIFFVFVLVLTLSSALLRKGLISLCLGMMLTVVGLDWGTGVFRYTSTIPELFDGIDFIVVVLGTFTLSEAFLMMESIAAGSRSMQPITRSEGAVDTCWKTRASCLRASIIGALIGMLPGIGTYVANLAAYRFEKRLAQRGGSFGSGDPRGLVAPEAANSATAICSFIPLLALGIPGSATTAVLLGALSQLNIEPGPALCRNQPEIIWALIASMFLGNLLLLTANLRFATAFPWLLVIPGWVFMPIVVVVSFVSVYAMSESLVLLCILVMIGVITYILRKFHYPLAPLILGYMLGKPFEDNLRLALALSDGSASTLIESPLALFLWASVFITLLARVGLAWRRRFW